MTLAATFLDTEIFRSRDVWQFLAWMVLNFTVAVLCIVAYRRGGGDKEHAFTFIVLNTVIFVVSQLMIRLDVSAGFGFGLFALFGIIRYRTDSLPVKEMSYLFAMTAIGVVNGVGQQGITWTEAILTNATVLLVLVLVERLWMPRQESTRTFLYDRIENILPDRYDNLVDDLKSRTGLDIVKVRIGKVNFLNDTAIVSVVYLPTAHTRSVLSTSDELAD